MDFMTLLIATCIRSAFVLRDRGPHAGNPFGFNAFSWWKRLHGTGAQRTIPPIEGIDHMQNHECGGDNDRITL